VAGVKPLQQSRRERSIGLWTICGVFPGKQDYLFLSRVFTRLPISNRRFDKLAKDFEGAMQFCSAALTTICQAGVAARSSDLNR
jgi:hypothetical protein